MNKMGEENFMSTKVMLVDDHALIREGIKQLLEFDGSIDVIEQASDGAECLEKLQHVQPDILLLDINMPNVNGIEVLEEIKKKNIPVKVLMLTVHSEAEYLVQAVESVMDGDSYIQPSLIPSLNSRLVNRDIDKEKIAALTKREMEILTQIAGGMFNKEIAMNLNISERTVKNHISNIFKKIDVSDRTQAAVFAIRNNIVKLF